MKIIFENLGPIEKGEIELNKLNIFVEEIMKEKLI